MTDTATGQQKAMWLLQDTMGFVMLYLGMAQG